MKKQSANVAPQTAVDFLGTDQRQVIYQDTLTMSCQISSLGFSFRVCLGRLALCYDKG